MKLRNTHLTTAGKDTSMLPALISLKMAERIQASLRKTKCEIFCHEAIFSEIKADNKLITNLQAAFVHLNDSRNCSNSSTYASHKAFLGFCLALLSWTYLDWFSAWHCNLIARLISLSYFFCKVFFIKPGLMTATVLHARLCLSCFYWASLIQKITGIVLAIISGAYLS